MFFTTIPQGERAAVWDPRGRMRLVDGPRRLFTFGERVEMLPRFAADPHDYLAITFRDGHKEHRPGPAAEWLDPVLHESITVEPAIAVDANDALVVYRRDNGTVSRRIVRGPALFVPAANEWLHQFSWHGADPSNPKRKSPRALQFTKLRIIPDQMYYDAEEVRTLDDALLTVKLMVFFELHDLEKMLDQTHDPIGDFINALSADVIDLVGALSFEEFKAQTERLNQLASYPQLLQRALRIGYTINKVVYRGYHASAKLQSMHDDAIERRTRLRLEAETEQQAQQLADLKLQREVERATQRRAMDEGEAAHHNRMKRAAYEETLRERQAELQQKLAARRQQHELELAHRRALHQEHAEYLKGMRDLQVDLTRYLVARYQNPDRLIRIDGTRPPQLHLHE